MSVLAYTSFDWTWWRVAIVKVATEEERAMATSSADVAGLRPTLCTNDVGAGLTLVWVAVLESWLLALS